MICMSPDLLSLNFAAKKLAQSGQSNLVFYLKISALSFSLKVCQQLRKNTVFDVLLWIFPAGTFIASAV